MNLKFKNRFLAFSLFYLFLVLLILLLWSAIVWLPRGFALAGHDSGLPLDAKQFLLSRFYAWDDRLGFGLDNSANFGSLTIHFLDWVSATLAGTPYSGNFISLFFWLGLIFFSAFIFAYQLKNICGRLFVFILPIFLTINFYIFQSVFMLERAKFGIFSATLISLGLFFRMLDGKMSLTTSVVLSAVVFSIFNGGGWFGITLYGGAAIILISLILTSLFKGLSKKNFSEFKRVLIYIVLTATLFLALNAYSILAYIQNFISADAPRLVQESSMEGHIDWLRYVSRSTSFINLFRFLGVPDWYGEPNELIEVNISHTYAPLYLNNRFLGLISFLLPLLSFLCFLLVKNNKQKRLLSIFGLISLFEIIFAAGSNSPFGFIYEFLMNHLPGFFLFRSAFYKFGIFYLFSTAVLFSATLSILIEKLADLFPNKDFKFKNAVVIVSLILIVGSWVGYHYVLFEPAKIFAWKTDQTTRINPPDYIYDFDKFVQENNFSEKRVLMIPPVNKDWENDAYNWGYWSLSPLPFALSSVRTLSNWHGLTSEELELVDSLYEAIKSNNEKSFLKQSDDLNVGYILIRQDVLTDSKWSASERPESYRAILQSFRLIGKVASFGQWELYKLNSTTNMQAFTISSVNLTSDNFVSLVGQLLDEGHTVGLTDKKKYPELEKLSLNKVYAYDCLSCLVEKQVRLKSLPDPVILPGSLLYHFKEVREQKVLSSSKDSRGKMADYLGSILTRSAEQKKMLDLSVKEERLLNNIAVIRLYLSSLYSEIQSNKDYAEDFELVSQVQDFLNPVDRVIGDYMKTNVSSAHSHRFDEEMLGILWDINKIRDYFLPILSNQKRWAYEKVYKPAFPESGNYRLSFSSQSFPRTLDGKLIFPKEIKFTKEDVKELKITEDKKGWLSVELGYQESGVGKLDVIFDELPNLFDIEETKIEKFPYGDVSCINGHIKNFDRKRAYEILISRTDRLGKVTAILKDKNKSYSDAHGFLKGEDIFEVPAVSLGEFSRDVYFPSGIAKDISLYVCSDNKIPPVIDKIYIHEFFSPSALITKKTDLNLSSPPNITYERINPTEYKGMIDKSDNLFILVFNEKNSHLWKLYIADEHGNWQNENKHFLIDGYANGWLIDKGNLRKFKIEYTPQFWFYVGSVISISVLTLCVFLLVRSFKNRN